jgi:hypothetical protein
MKERQLAEFVRSKIYGYPGTKKWRVATAFARSLTDTQRRRFVVEYKQTQSLGGLTALGEAARRVGSSYNIAAELMAPDKNSN